MHDMNWALIKLVMHTDAALIVLLFAGMILFPLFIIWIFYSRLRDEGTAQTRGRKQYRLDLAIALLSSVPFLLWTVFFLIRSQSRLSVIATVFASALLCILLSGPLAFANPGKGRNAILTTLFVIGLSVSGVFAWAFYTEAVPGLPGF